jgi:hypothetical protein
LGPVHGLQRWNGTNWALVPSTTLTQSGCLTRLAAHDDGSGHGARLFGLTSSDDLVEHDGAEWSVRLFTEPYFTFAFLFADDRLPGGGGILLRGNFRVVFAPGDAPTAQSGLVIAHDCPRVTSFCAGDGQDAQLGVACPCANSGAIGHGCAWNASGSGVAGGRLDSSGSPLEDDLVLTASTMPTGGTSLFSKARRTPPAPCSAMACAARAVR